MTRNKLTGSIAVVAVLFVAAWSFGLFGGTDSAVAELQQMADQAFSQNLTEAQEAQYRDQFRQRMDTLTPEQRDAFFDANRDRWMQRMEQRMDEYFAMTPADQQKRLDEILNRMSQPRERRPEAGGDNTRGGDRGRGGWGNLTEGQRDERSKRRLDRTSPKMRAQFSEFRKQLEDRAKERGITQLPGWGRGGPRG
jgi:ABC-type transporter MlaC component